ncbi:MAG: sugar phosphate isomerase/epimerase [Pelobium sp.]
MNKRREFIAQLGVLAAGVAIAPSLGCTAMPKNKKFGIQLYSLREHFNIGVEEVIAKVAKAGYSFVEPYGYTVKDGFWGLTSKEFRKLLDKYQLTCPSGHYNFANYQESGDLKIIQEYIDAANVLGSQYITVPHLNPEIYKDEDKTRAWLKQLNDAAKMLKDAGLKLAYHNHDIEFYPLPNNQTAYEILLNGTDPELVDFEMDIYWIYVAKKDPLDLFKKYPNRFKLWHIKDMNKNDPKINEIIGKGTIDYLPIFKAAKLSGLKYAIMEQETFTADPFESITESAKYLNQYL